MNLSICSILVGQDSSAFGSKITESDEDDDGEDSKGDAVFSSSWLPAGTPKYVHILLHHLPIPTTYNPLLKRKRTLET